MRHWGLVPRKARLHTFVGAPVQRHSVDETANAGIKLAADRQMRQRSRQIVLTLVGGALLVGAELLLTDLLAVDLFLVLFVPYLVLLLARLRPVLHWALFGVIAAATVITLVRIEESESSTAGFGVVVVPMMLTIGVLIAALLDRVIAAHSMDIS
jgi:hypothetical protein